MNRSRVRELHYITPLVNVRSMLDHGILSYRRAARVPHASVANTGVQDLREGIRLPNGRALHDHVNLYFDARNPMMYVLHERHRELAVLRVEPSVLDLPNVMVSDGNAARRFRDRFGVQFGTRFYPPDQGIDLLDEAVVFSDDWNHPDPQIKDELKRRRCAEVLVPDRVAPAYILGAYVSCDASREVMVADGCAILIAIQEHMFFFGLRRQG